MANRALLTPLPPDLALATLRYNVKVWRGMGKTDAELRQLVSRKYWEVLGIQGAVKVVRSAERQPRHVNPNQSITAAWEAIRQAQSDKTYLTRADISLAAGYNKRWLSNLAYLVKNCPTRYGWGEELVAAADSLRQYQDHPYRPRKECHHGG